MDIEKREEQLGMILRQTDYSKETAEHKLIEFNNDIMAVIRDYMKPSASPTQLNTSPIIKSSKNQQIYKEIRIMMDNASRNYEEKKAQQQTPSQIIHEKPLGLNTIREEEEEINRIIK